MMHDVNPDCSFSIVGMLIYQGKLATAQSERDFLRAENQVLKELQRVNQVPGTREEKQHSAVG